MRTLLCFVITALVSISTLHLSAQQSDESIRFNLYYDLNKYDIKPQAAKKLAHVLKVMNEYPELVIELSSHTDSRASFEYNKKLSKNRANSAKEWLVKNGITADRVVAVGYGETKLVNTCSDGVNCKETDHQKNRRTELKVITGPQLSTIARSLVTYETEETCGCKDMAAAIRNEGTIAKEVPKIEFEKAVASKSSTLQSLEIEGGLKMVKTRLKFTNKSRLPLVVKSIKAKDMSIRVVDWQKSKLKRGEIGWVEIVYDPMVSKVDYGLQHTQLIVELEGTNENLETVNTTNTLVLMSKMNNSEQLVSRIK